MTPTSIGTLTTLVIAILAAAVTVIAYVHTNVMPKIGSLIDDFYDLRQGHALSVQTQAQLMARANGQSAKIDTLLLAATPPIVAQPTPVPAAAPAPVPVPAPVPATTDAPPPPADTAAPGIVGTLLNAVGLAPKDPAPTDKDPAPKDPEPAAQTAAPTVNVTITTDRALSADEIALAHKALDAQAGIAPPQTGGSPQ